MKARFYPLLFIVWTPTLWANQIIVECRSAGESPTEITVLYNDQTHRAQILRKEGPEVEAFRAGSIYAILGGEAKGEHNRAFLEATYRDDSVTDWNDPELAERCYVINKMGHSLRIDVLNKDPLKLSGRYVRWPNISIRPNSDCNVPNFSRPPEIILSCNRF